jgi:hypothetical protein
MLREMRKYGYDFENDVPLSLSLKHTYIAYTKPLNLGGLAHVVFSTRLSLLLLLVNTF